MHTETKSIGIIGSGSWATALIKMISDAGHTVHWWIRNPEKASYIQTHLHNPDYLSSIEIHADKVIVSNDLQFVLNSCGVIILAVPSAFIHQSLHGVVLPTENIYVSAIKGIEPNTNLVMAKYLEKNHGIPTDQVAIITGRRRKTLLFNCCRKHAGCRAVG
jgi:glycerol-3-phosphate dehydrogenase (NAD(P)+)